MPYATVLLPTITLLLGGVIGHYIGREQSRLIDTIQSVLQRTEKPPENLPAITMGEYVEPREISNVVDDTPVGLVESKTPQRVEWETSQKIDKEVRGI